MAHQSKFNEFTLKIEELKTLKMRRKHEMKLEAEGVGLEVVEGEERLKKKKNNVAVSERLKKKKNNVAVSERSVEVEEEEGRRVSKENKKKEIGDDKRGEARVSVEKIVVNESGVNEYVVNESGEKIGVNESVVIVDVSEVKVGEQARGLQADANSHFSKLINDLKVEIVATEKEAESLAKEFKALIGPEMQICLTHVAQVRAAFLLEHKYHLVKTWTYVRGKSIKGPLYSSIQRACNILGINFVDKHLNNN